MGSDTCNKFDLGGSGQLACCSWSVGLLEGEWRRTGLKKERGGEGKREKEEKVRGYLPHFLPSTSEKEKKFSSMGITMASVNHTKQLGRY